MFRKKRPKKEFPPGTFIPTQARVAAIIQLCLAFVVLLSSISYPFLGEIFANKTEALLYSDIMGNTSAADANSISERERLQRNGERFEAMEENARMQIVEHYHQLHAKAKTSFFEKIGSSFSILVSALPAFKQAWIIFSIVISILLLLRIEGANYAALLLPVIAFCYAYDNYNFGVPRKSTAQEKLFPTEQVIVNDYLRKPLSSDIMEQQHQLQHGWHLYLIEKWARQRPSEDAKVFSQQVEDGEFAFNLARIGTLGKRANVDSIFKEREHFVMLLLYVLWNGFFAWTVNRWIKPCPVP